VAYSGTGDAADRQAAEAAGFTAFFVKPSSASELIGL
jgi:CheY-like chemotaxis protein